MKYAIIVWRTKQEMLDGTGEVYGWYESLATALNTATNLSQLTPVAYFNATVVKAL